MPEIPVGTWTIDPVHSSVTFTACVNRLSSIGGRFDAFAGTITFDADGDHHARGAVQTTSIDTNLNQRDEYLRGEATFAAADHPELAFETDTLRLDAGGALHADGRLTMRGSAQPLHLTGQLSGPLVDHFDARRIGVDLAGAVSCSAFGIGGLPVVDDRVEIRLGLQAVAAEPA